MKSIIYAQRIQPGDDPTPTLAKLTAAAGGLAFIRPGSKVLLKPNYVAPFPRATTDFSFLDFFIEAVREAGGEPVVGEMSGYEFDTESTLEILGVRPFLNQRGVEFINLEQATYSPLSLGSNLPEVEVADIALAADHIINLPVLKGHTITKMTGATKNFFGLLSRTSRRRLHCYGLDKGIAALARAFDTSLHVMDARYLLTRAVFGETSPLNYILVGTDSFALDYFGCHLLGINPDSVKHLDHTPEYILKGPCPKERTLSDKASVKERIHRLLYSCFYYIDEYKCRLVGGSSLIPHFHWVLGIHPDVSGVPRDRISEVADLCPIGAIDRDKKIVIKEKCITVRCLRCYTQDPTDKVTLKGLNTPKAKKIS